MTIPAGGQTKLTIRHDPAEMKKHVESSGPFTHYVDILSNDPAAQQVRFSITGEYSDS